MNPLTETISNMELISIALEKVANKQENYNKPYAEYLEHISYDIRKSANELKEIAFVYGGF
jgi:hypothetical protein